MYGFCITDFTEKSNSLSNENTAWLKWFLTVSLFYLIGAPAGKIHIPVMKSQLSVSYSVSTIKSHQTSLNKHNAIIVKVIQDVNKRNDDTITVSTSSCIMIDKICKYANHLSVSCFCNGLHVKKLTGVILNATEHDQSHAVSLPLDDGQDIFCS